MKKEQLGELVIQNEDALYHVAKTLLYSDADCADAIQEAIVKAFTNLHTLRNDSFAKTWLIRILINECYAVMRREKRIVSLESYQYEEAGDTADYSDLYEAISRLPQEIRLCVTLYYLEGYRVKRQPRYLALPKVQENRLARARAKLRGELEEAMV